MTKQPDPHDLLRRLADALNDCEDAGLKIKLRHGPVIMTPAGYVLRFGRAWRTGFPLPDTGPDRDDLDD